MCAIGSKPSCYRHSSVLMIGILGGTQFTGLIALSPYSYRFAGHETLFAHTFIYQQL